MKKIISLTIAVLMLVAMLAGSGNSAPAATEAASANSGKEFTVGVCQLMVHESLGKATQGFIDALTAEVEASGNTVKIDTQVAGDVVGVLYCTNESNSLIQYEAVKALFEAEGIVVNAYTFSETTELQALTTAMAGEVKAVYVPSDNTVAANDTIVGTICTEKNIPVYTSYGGAVCYASLSIDYYQLGYETGKMAASILLEGKSPADIEVMTLTPAVAYNEELCAQLGIEVK